MEPSTDVLQPIQVVQTKPTYPKLNAALAKAQTEIFNPGKNRTVEVQGKDGKRGYSYDYAELNVVTEIIRGPCARNGLSFTQSPASKDNRHFVETVIMHESGEERSYLYPLYTTERQGMKNEQIFASGFTYAKRQALKGIFGIADDTEDADAHERDTGVKITQKNHQWGNAPKPSGNPSPIQSKPAGAPPSEQQMMDKIHQSTEPPLLDQLVWLAEEKAIPNDEMSKIIARVVGGPKKAKELTEDELSKVVSFVKSYVTPKKAE